MDKTFLHRVNSSLKTIKTQILLNENIRKMLYYDDVVNNLVPTIEIMKDYVFLQPVINVDTIEPFNKKNYITITIPEGNKQSNKMLYTVRIIVMCDKTSWQLNTDIRPLLISQEIINILDGYKLDMSNKLSFSSIVETVTSKDVYGYSLLFDITDGISDIYEK